ncbi:MAG: hypothetical protein AAGA55_08420 [Planctomycetota bacterium]
MPMHHACHSCGYPLSARRPGPDPHYNLPVVTCPECATSVVRRRDPGVLGFRTAWKTGRALLYVLIQSLMAFLLSFMAAVMMNNIARTAREEYLSNPLAVFITQPELLRQDQIGPQLGVLSVVLLFVGILTGAWIRSALNHLNVVLVTAAFVLIPLAFLLQFGLRYWLWDRFLSDAYARPWGDFGMLSRTPDILTASVMHAACVAAGFPLANTLRTLWAGQQRARWHRRRRAARRLREDR